MRAGIAPEIRTGFAEEWSLSMVKRPSRWLFGTDGSPSSTPLRLRLEMLKQFATR